MVNSGQNDEECDATDDDSSSSSGLRIVFIFLLQLIFQMADKILLHAAVDHLLIK